MCRCQGHYDCWSQRYFLIVFIFLSMIIIIFINIVIVVFIIITISSLLFVSLSLLLGNMFDAVVRALASNHPARVRFSDLVWHVGRVCCWFSPLLRGFFFGSSAFPPSIKTIILIPIRTGNSGQQEPHRGMSTPTYHLFFYFIIIIIIFRT